MNCLSVRQLTLVDPLRLPEKERQHLQSCENCKLFYTKIVSSDEDIRSLMDIEIPNEVIPRIKLANLERPLKEKPTKTSLAQLSIAASLIFLIVFGGYQYQQLQQQSQANRFRLAVVNYIVDEPEILNRKLTVEKTELEKLIRSYGGDLKTEIAGVSVAEPCKLYEDLDAAHLVIPGSKGPVTVMYSSTNNVSESFEFTHQNFSGLHYPVDQGSVVLVAYHGEDFVPIIEKLNRAIAW